MIKRYVCENSLVYPEKFINTENTMKLVKGFQQQGYELTMLQSGNMLHVMLKRDEKLVDRTTFIEYEAATEYFDSILNYITSNMIKE